ncbi:c-type cytochrome [Piscinibacter sp. XHJ-5]|uniref:c-type cytochrome n=1 Tax=Piscinibacter sp. XHJ-5 TaxID=3037797 RepID=UPI002452DB6A|nr:c-type cytochrome [Piscinibacter sp. XHJ-5]
MPGSVRMKTVLATLLIAALLALAGMAVFIAGGFYDISATEPHTPPVHALLEATMRRSVKVRAADIVTPPLGDAATVERGAACYRDHCLQCHGGPGVPHGDIAKGLQPLPDPLAGAVRQWRPRELYWIVRHGIKMSGMPAWETRLPDADLWAVVAFLDRLPELSPAAFTETLAATRGARCLSASQGCESPGCRPIETADTHPLQHRDAQERAKLLLRQYACPACHMIPGIVGAQTHVGPPLAGLGRRERIAGKLPNDADNLVRWIRSPQSVDPSTAMPDMGVTEAHARQMAAYLESLR